MSTLFNWSFGYKTRRYELCCKRVFRFVVKFIQLLVHERQRSKIIVTSRFSHIFQIYCLPTSRKITWEFGQQSYEINAFQFQVASWEAKIWLKTGLSVAKMCTYFHWPYNVFFSPVTKILLNYFQVFDKSKRKTVRICFEAWNAFASFAVEFLSE